MRLPKTTVITLLGICLLCSCSKPGANSTYARELHSFLKNNAADSYRFDSIQVRIRENRMYQIDYLVEIQNTGSTPDSLSLLVPLLISPTPLQTLGPLKTPGQTSDLELLDATSKTGNSYFIAVLPPDLIARKTDTATGIARLRLSCDFASLIPSQFAFPGGTDPGWTELVVTNPPGSKFLSNNPSQLISDDLLPAHLYRLPEDVNPEQRTYVLQTKLDQDEYLKLNPELRLLPTAWKIASMITIAAFMALLLFKLLIKISEEKNRWPHKSSFSYRPLRFFLMPRLMLYKHSRVKDVEQLQQQLWQERGRILESPEYLNKEQFPNPNHRADLYIANVQQMNRLQRLKNRILIRSIWRWLQSPIILIVVLGILLLLFSQLASAQTHKPRQPLLQYALKDASLEFTPTFTDHHDLQMNAFWKFLIVSKNNDSKYLNVNIKVYGKDNELSSKSIDHTPDSVRISPFPLQEQLERLDSFLISSQYHGPLTPGEQQVGQNSNPYLAKLVSSEGKKFNNIYTTVTVPFTRFTVKREGTWHINGMKFSLFPFDKATIRIPLQFGQITNISGIKIMEIDRYNTEISSNNSSLGFTDDDGFIKLAGDSSVWIPPGQKVILTLSLDRGIATKFIMPILILIIFFVCYRIEDNAWLKNKQDRLWFSLTAVLLGIYGFVRLGYYTDVPNFWHANGDINIYDLFMWTLLLVAAVTGIRRVNR